MEANCPFCGSENINIDLLCANPHPTSVKQQYRMKCRDCGAATRWCATEEDAGAAWNRRSAKVPDSVSAPVPFGKDLFFYKENLYVRNPQNGFCFISDKNGYKRIKKADYLLAYAECAKAAGKITA
jgi:Lar family restriction alleviation protein